MNHCPNCQSSKLDVFYEHLQVPVHSTLLLKSKEEALHFPKGDIVLALCRECGFITNTRFDPREHRYGQQYEETQGFSPTFRRFHQALAQELIQRHELHEKKILEIGCGKGEFLSLLCELGQNEGVGVDPAYVDWRNTSSARERMRFVTEFYGHDHARYQADFICCKMTLEHIPDSQRFLKLIHDNIDTNRSPVLFIQVPNAEKVFRDGAFWDIYYEHCSYFTEDSLSAVSEGVGFQVNEIKKTYSDQYLCLEATPGHGKQPAQSPSTDEQGKALVQSFLSRKDLLIDQWTHLIKESEGPIVLWGGGSKGVAFLTRLNLTSEVACVVDINPYKHGKFMAGSGHPIVAPAALKRIKPKLVILMNPVYQDEVANILEKLDLFPKILPLA